MRIHVVEDQFARARLLVERLRRSGVKADHAATPVDALMFRPREFLNQERSGAPTLSLRGVGNMPARSAS